MAIGLLGGGDIRQMMYSREHQAAINPELVGHGNVSVQIVSEHYCLLLVEMPNSDEVVIQRGARLTQWRGFSTRDQFNDQLKRSNKNYKEKISENRVPGQELQKTALNTASAARSSIVPSRTRTVSVWQVINASQF